MTHFSFLDYILSKYQWIFTNLGMCIAIVIWVGIANGQILSIFDRVKIHIFILVQ